MNKSGKTLSASKIKTLLADQLGIDPEDISNDDSLVDDLHMGATELTDFLGKVEDSGIDTSGVDLREIETVEELLEKLGVGEFI